MTSKAALLSKSEQRTECNVTEECILFHKWNWLALMLLEETTSSFIFLKFNIHQARIKLAL
jgi:hypothetical protein